MSFLQVIYTTGLVLASFAGIVTALRVLAGSPIIGTPIKYIWRKTLSEPLSFWFVQRVETAVDERITHRLNQPNGGSSLYDISLAVHEIQVHLGMTPRSPHSPPGNERGTRE